MVHAPIVSPAVVVRKQALIDRSIDIHAVLEVFGEKQSVVESKDLVSVGPLFGSEAVLSLIRLLESHGLAYVDDFYAIEHDTPDWLRLGAELSGG